jgi:2'-hydroxyisoflavone reductase
MHLLLIGGTQFVGRHLTEGALARGHAVTLFNRGKMSSDLPPRAQHLPGDRKRNLHALAGGRSDAVVDTCGYRPTAAQAFTQAGLTPEREAAALAAGA